MKSLSLKALEKDKERINQMIAKTQIQLYRLDGILRYLEDNIKALKEVKHNDR